ncbi:MAG: filamentous hemagglutinin N-terminal domain-containing protein [Hormoscilla sp.]
MRKAIVSLGLLSHIGATIALQVGPFGMPVQAQIVPDATLPSNSQVTANGSRFTIDGGTVRGSNHFHSFTEFSVPTGAEAFFNNGSAIDNIITRVTGGSISNIDGLIRANGGANVNLFLLNPNGIIFGPNARLDIGGSFLGSTAESLLFSDGSFYSATNPEAPPLLTINVPLGLQLGPNSGSIRVQGPGHNLTQQTFTVIRDNRPTGIAVSPGNSLTLVGAEVNLEGGNLTAIDGRVELGGAVKGRVGITPASGLEYDGVQKFGDIRLSGAASIDASGAGGTVQLVGRQIHLREASAIISNATGPVDSGPFSLRATESVEMVEGTETFPTGLFNQVEQEVTGNSGQLTITTGQLIITDGAVVNNSAAGIGSTGSLQVTADVVELRGNQGFNVSGLYSQVLPFANGGNSGNMTIVAGRLLLLDGGVISTGTFGDGNAGDLIIRATESVELRGIGEEVMLAGEPVRESSRIFSTGGASPRNNKLPDTVTGKAGNITIDTEQLILADGAFIESSTSRSQDGANLTIRATDSVILRGNNPSASPFRDTKSSFLSSGVDAARLPDGSPFQPTANGGNITIDTGSLILEDGAVISAETQGIGNAGNLSVRASVGVQLRGFDNEGQGSSMVTIVSEGAMGDAGVITIETDRLMLTDGASISSETLGNGNSGNVVVRAQSLRARDQSQLSVSSEIPENFGAGTLEIAAAKIELENEAGFLAETAAGDRGNINVESQDLRLRRDAFISTNATRTATGGNITINADTIVSLFNSDISANAIQGAGGNIFIGTSGIFLSPDSEITATSEFGVAGTVTISNPDADPAAALKLPENYVDASRLLGKDFCQLSKNSSFIITGRGGLPRNPGDYLTPDFGRVHLVDPVPVISDDAARSSNASRRRVRQRVRPEVDRNRERSIVEATGFVRHPDGTIELVADASAGPAVLRLVTCDDLAR